jgi:hypothetical protein
MLRIGYMSGRKARLLIRDRVLYADDAAAHVTIWELHSPVRGSSHDYKYRLAYVVQDQCVLHYDNEAGKDDHRHWGDTESSYEFRGLAQLLVDFRSDIARWNHENGMV